MKIDEFYTEVAKIAHEEDVPLGDQLFYWIRKNCQYRRENEFVIFNGITTALTDMRDKERAITSPAH